MVSLVTIKNALFKKLQGDPGKSVYVDTLGDGGGKDSASIYFPSGFFSSPHDGIEGVKVDTGEFNVIVGTQNYKIDITLDKGEAKIFSYDADGVVLASLKFDKNGKSSFNDGVRTAVAFAELKAGVDQLKADHNDLITMFNKHVHATAAVGPPVPPTVDPAPPAIPGVASTASIDGSEVDEVLFP